MTVNNNSIISKKALKVSLQGSQLHYCAKKEGDLEEDRVLPTVKFTEQQSPEKSLHLLIEHTQVAESRCSSNSSGLLTPQSDYSPSVRYFTPTQQSPNNRYTDLCSKIKTKEIMVSVISFLTMNETIAFINLSKQEVRKNFIKDIIKHQRYLIV